MPIMPNKYNLEKARIDFFSLGKEDTPYARKEILDSWIRSKNYNVDPNNIKKPILSKEKLHTLIKENQLLYDVAVPLMETFYNFLKGSGFILILADTQGYILKTLGDEDILFKARTQVNGLVEGANRSEHAIGTNAIGTCLHLGRPVEIWADEHFYTSNQQWSCSGAPILDEKNNVLGVLCLSGTWDKVNTHTLGMATAVATSLSKQLQLREAFSTLQLTTNKLQTTIDSLADGIFLLDNKLTITQVNSSALAILNQTPDALLNQSITDIVPDFDLNSIKKNSYDVETDIVCNKTTVRTFMTIKSIPISAKNPHASFLLMFREGKHVRKLANKLAGSNAHFNFEDIVGNSKAVIEAKHIARIASQNDSTVLLIGESGTGKELFAQSIHNNSSYKKGPFVAINCAAIPRTLIESELFGYVGGTFTGAKKDGQPGKFELANGGTIFLDEIGDMPYEVQSSLLRILQTKEIVRVGGSKPIPIDVRIIAATNVNLELAMENKTFRNDLFYRLNVFNIKIPSLQERFDDILLLSDYFIEKYKIHTNHSITSIDEEAKNALLRYPWPGNIRELENTIERACLLSNGSSILTINELPDNIRSYICSDKSSTSENDTTTKPSNASPINDAEKTLIVDHLITTKGNIKKAAESLNISRRTLYRKLDRYGIDLDKIRSHQ